MQKIYTAYFLFGHKMSHQYPPSWANKKSWKITDEIANPEPPGTVWSGMPLFALAYLCEIVFFCLFCCYLHWHICVKLFFFCLFCCYLHWHICVKLFFFVCFVAICIGISVWNCFFCLFCCFTSQVNSYGHGRTVSLPNHSFFPGQAWTSS